MKKIQFTEKLLSQSLRISGVLLINFQSQVANPIFSPHSNAILTPSEPHSNKALKQALWRAKRPRINDLPIHKQKRPHATTCSPIYVNLSSYERKLKSPRCKPNVSLCKHFVLIRSHSLNHSNSLIINFFPHFSLVLSSIRFVLCPIKGVVKCHPLYNFR